MAIDPTGSRSRHLQSVFAALPRCIQTIFARADAGFYCWEAVQAYEKAKAHFIIVACKTARLLEQLQTADWKPSRNTDADEQCEFRYQPEGWGQAYRFIALRYEKKDPEKREQYQLFDTPGNRFLFMSPGLQRTFRKKQVHDLRRRTARRPTANCNLRLLSDRRW